jgi:hypothetical protein
VIESLTSAQVADRGEILRSQVGSGVHGIAVEGTDDRDEMGVFIEPPDRVMGVNSPLDTVTWRSKPEGTRSEPGDLDLVRHSLRKYLRLAVKGNPNFLLLLFAPAEQLVITSELGEDLRRLRHVIVSRKAVHQTLGYLDGQLERLMNEHKLPNRPELIERYGFDVKYASHAVRLAYQAYEIAVSGVIVLPMKPESRQVVLNVKTGKYSKASVLAMVGDIKHDIERAMGPGRCPLPAEPDYDLINRFAIRAHHEFWNRPSI